MFARTFHANRLAVDFGFTRARQLGGVHSGVWRKAMHLAGLNEHRASGLDMLRLMGRQARAWLSRVRHRLPTAFLANAGLQSPQAMGLPQSALQSVPRVTALRASSLADERSWLFRHPLWWTVGLALLAVQWYQMTANHDDVTVVWTPPIEPPGTVIVTGSYAPPGSAPSSVALVGLAKTGSSAPIAAAIPAIQPVNVAQAKMDVATVESGHSLKSGGASTAAQTLALRSALDQWSQAWRQQNMQAYLAMYAENFATPQGQSRSAWEEMRTTRILGKKKISHEIRDLTVKVDASTAVVTFTQIYQDERMKMTDLKTIHWVQRDGRWLITRETTG